MALEVTRVGEVSVVSVHDEEEPIHFSIPSVVPSRYDIPGTSAPREVFAQCRMTIEPGKPGIQYALHRTLNHKPYVLIKIVEPNTFIYGTEQQKIDEFGQRLAPDVMRVPVPVRVEAMANEMERIYGAMGIKAIRGDITEEILAEVEKRYVEFLRKRVQQTTVWAAKNPMNVTPQARRSAFQLYKKGLLNPMPQWALMDPNAEGMERSMFNCENCHRLISKDTIRCECGAVYDWAKYEKLFVSPSRRADGPGQVTPPATTAVPPAPPAPVQESLASDDPMAIGDGGGLSNTSEAELRGRAAEMAREQETTVLEGEL